MRTRLYKEYVIASLPELDISRKVWLIKAAIFWQQNADVHTHSLRPPRSCPTEAEALEEGFRLAELWIDHKL
jgi:hypothetical protein